MTRWEPAPPIQARRNCRSQTRRGLVVFQEPALFPWLNAMGNVLFGLKLKPNLTNRQRREIAEHYLRLVGLEKFRHA